jgi:hypothetical protein
MQHRIRILWILSALLSYQGINATTDRKAKNDQINKITQKYEKKDRKIAEKYTELHNEYNCKKYKKNDALLCSKEALPLSLLSELAEARPETTTTFYPSMVPEDDVIYFLEETVSLAKDELLFNDLWVNKKSPYNPHFFNTASHANFKPFMQKMIVPAGSTIFAWGDTHGCVHSLIRTLQQLQKWDYLDDNFMITQPDTYLIYLGDCVDRGCYGLEVLYILMRLKAANPDNVILIRGNHEDEHINRTVPYVRFHDELTQKQFRQKNKLYRLYDMLPPVLYIGSGNEDDRAFIMCCHGGLEIGLRPTALLTAPDDVCFMAINGLNRQEMIDNLPARMKDSLCSIVPPHARTNMRINTPTKPVCFGYMWSDFLIEDPKELVRCPRHGGWSYGKELTQHLLDRDGGPKHCIKSILRAHQHQGIMQQHIVAHHGYHSMWDGLVYTVLSAPAIKLSPPCHYDSMMKITTGATWQDWKFTHLSKEMPPQYTKIHHK